MVRIPEVVAQQEFTGERITKDILEQFRKAVSAQFGTGTPLTFPTTFRKAEFKLLDDFQVDMRDLLHTEQTYEYLSPLEVGDIPQVVTKLVEAKAKRGLLFVTLETVVNVEGKTKVRSDTHFVVKSGKGNG